MSDFFLGQVFMTGFQFPPLGSAQCNGQLLPIAQNQALFALLGTQFGGNGQNNFALPDLRGRTPVGYQPSVDPFWLPAQIQIGQAGGVESVTLTSLQIPSHEHTLAGSAVRATSADPTNLTFAVRRSTRGYSTAQNSSASLSAISAVGGSQPHTNIQPYTTINFCIALQGIFPARD